MKTTSFVVVFSCLHTRIFADTPPAVGETIWCPQCQAYKDVATAPHSYAVKCLSCGLHREYGSAYITADTAAVRHGVRCAGHRVQLYDGGSLVREVLHPTIHVDLTVPPF